MERTSMGLEAVRATLKDAVAALFTAPQSLPTDTTSADVCATCGGSLVLPLAWRALREFPVCVRFVVSAWSRLATSYAPTQTTNEKTVKRKSAASNSAMELRATSMARLCAVLYQCGLIACAEDDSEVVAMVVDAMDTDTSPCRSTLCRLLQQRTLARCVRFSMLQHALCVQPQKHSDSTWVGEIALALQGELLQASLEPIARDGSIALSARDSKKRGRESIGKLTKTAGAAVCAVCAESRDDDLRTARAITCHRISLVESLKKWVRAGEIDVTVVEAVKSLIGVLHAPEVIHLLERKRPVSSITRARTSISVRSTRGIASSKITWGDCDRIVDAINPTPLWRIVWRREGSRVNRAAMTLPELVVVCALADQFAYSTSSTCSSNDDSTIGFRVLQSVINQSIRSPRPILTIVRAITVAVDHYSAAASSVVLRTSFRSTHGHLLDYVRYFLDEDEIHDSSAVSGPDSKSTVQGRVKNSAKKEFKTSTRVGATMGDLLECVELLHALVVGASKTRDTGLHDNRRDLFVMWFQLIVKFSRDASSHHETVATHWSSFLDAIAQCCEVLHSTSRPSTLSFQAFVGEMVVGILVSGGGRISSPDGCDIESIVVPMDATSQSMLQTLLGMILNADTKGQVVAASVYRLLVVVNRQQQVRRQSLSQISSDGIEFPRILFPLLNTYTDMSNSDESVETTVSKVVAQVHSQIHQHRDSTSLARTLVRLLHGWDSYNERHAKSIAAVVATHNEEKHGLQAAREHGVWQDLVRFYAADKTNCIARESDSFLVYVSDFLRGNDPDCCPSELEGSLFSVVTKISSVLAQSQVRHGPALVAHSDETIARFIRAFESPTDGHDCRQLVNVLKHTGKLEDLALNLRRWLGILTAGPTSLLAEKAANLVMLANRLVYWCPSELSVVKALFVPVDEALRVALQFYSTSPPSSTAQVSVVRLSIMVRAYLAVSRVPDLVALTTAILDATINCISSVTRDGLLKLMRGFSAFLIAEVVADKLHTALLLVNDRIHLRLVRNALAILTVAPDMLRPRVIGFTTDVFSVATAEQWLATLLFVGVSTDSISMTSQKAVEALLACLESLLSQDDRSALSLVFQHGYALDALLSTALLALPPTDDPGSLPLRISATSRQLQSHLRGLEEILVAGNLPLADRNQLFLVVTSHKQSQPQQQRKRKRPVEMKYFSGIVRVDQGCITGLEISPPPPRGWQKAVDPTTAEAISFRLDDGTTRPYLAFASWLVSALMVQQQLPVTSAGIEPTHNAWEPVFSEIVLQFYLPVQYHGDMDALTTELLATWIQQSLVAGHNIEFLPFQRTMLLQHLAVANPWRHFTDCARLLLAGNIPRTAGREILNHVVGSLDLVVLSSTRTINGEAVTAMADDLSALLEQLSSDPMCLGTVAPLIETFVRASLLVSLRETKHKTVIDAVTRVGVFLRQLFMQSDASVRWWHGVLATWKRQLSHMNRRDASRIFGALKVKISTSTDDPVR